MKKFENIDAIVEQTLDLLPTALSGDVANRTFFIDENGKVDYHYYAGSITLDDSCFYTIKDYETPDLEDYGCDSLDEIDWEAAGYADNIRASIEMHIQNIEA